MPIVNGLKFSCSPCIKGHRSANCPDSHGSRPLLEVKKKGRPPTQCQHCRELRKTKALHSKCICADKAEDRPLPLILPNGLNGPMGYVAHGTESPSNASDASGHGAPKASGSIFIPSQSYSSASSATSSAQADAHLTHLLESQATLGRKRSVTGSRKKEATVASRPHDLAHGQSATSSHAHSSYKPYPRLLLPSPNVDTSANSSPVSFANSSPKSFKGLNQSEDASYSAVGQLDGQSQHLMSTRPFTQPLQIETDARQSGSGPTSSSSSISGRSPAVQRHTPSPLTKYEDDEIPMTFQLPPTLPLSPESLSLKKEDTIEPIISRSRDEPPTPISVDDYIASLARLDPITLQNLSQPWQDDLPDEDDENDVDGHDRHIGSGQHSSASSNHPLDDVKEENDDLDIEREQQYPQESQWYTGAASDYASDAEGRAPSQAESVLAWPPEGGDKADLARNVYFLDALTASAGQMLSGSSGVLISTANQREGEITNTDGIGYTFNGAAFDIAEEITKWRSDLESREAVTTGGSGTISGRGEIGDDEIDWSAVAGFEGNLDRATNGGRASPYIELDQPPSRGSLSSAHSGYSDPSGYHYEQDFDRNSPYVRPTSASQIHHDLAYEGGAEESDDVEGEEEEEGTGEDDVEGEEDYDGDEGDGETRHVGSLDRHDTITNEREYRATALFANDPPRIAPADDYAWSTEDESVHGDNTSSASSLYDAQEGPRILSFFDDQDHMGLSAGGEGLINGEGEPMPNEEGMNSDGVGRFSDGGRGRPDSELDFSDFAAQLKHVSGSLPGMPLSGYLPDLRQSPTRSEADKKPFAQVQRNYNDQSSGETNFYQQIGYP